MPEPLTAKKINKLIRIDKAMGEYFAAHPDVKELLAKSLMKYFIKKALFERDVDSGSPIRQLLTQAKKENKLDLLKHCKAIHRQSRFWYFTRIQ